VSAYLTVRTAGDPAALVPAVREAVLTVDPTAPPSDVRLMSDRVDGTMAQRRFYTTLVTLFAASALLLAAAGIYGTVSYFVARRTRDLAIRLALGAARNGIMGLVVRRAVRLAVWGVLLGLGGVWLSTLALEGLVFGLRPMDPLTLAGGCALLATVAVAAAVFPARRAVRVAPVLALRTE
jgi:ABC-type antimicrobial peptide transport system permease subunit